MTNQFYVYVYYDENNEPMYVGKGKNRRAWDHLCRKDMHPFVQKIQKMLRYGIPPAIEKFVCASEIEAFATEIFLISEIGRKDLKTGPLLNLCDGGEGASGSKRSAETKSKISAAGKGRKLSEETKARISAARKGRKHSAEAKARMSVAAKGIPQGPPSAEHRAKLSAAGKGRKHSAEAKAKMSAAAKGISKSAAHRAKLSASQKAKYSER